MRNPPIIINTGMQFSFLKSCQNLHCGGEDEVPLWEVELDTMAIGLDGGTVGEAAILAVLTPLWA